MITSVETALVADDDVLMREFVVETLTRNGINVTHVANGLEAKKLLEEKNFDLVFLDLKMPGMDGMQVLKHMQSAGIQALTVIVTAFGTVEKAVEAMKLGAYDFLMKPFSPEQVEIIIKRAKEWVALQAQNAYLQEELGWKSRAGREIIGDTPAIKALRNDIAKVARSAATVLICGESGVGKELVAHAIHNLSDRRGQPFVRLNCAAVPETLMDSELFGHEKGAFTNAVATRLGRFELANHGTLLLDEISEMPLGVQAKLLRVLQEREFERVGGSRTIKTDCRILATTNRNLKQWVAEGKFRQDLFYRLNVVPLHVPPLRERLDDLLLLIETFVERFGRSRREGGGRVHFAPETMQILRAYSWPGNVRELEHLVERLCIMADQPLITPADLPLEFRDLAAAAQIQAPAASPASTQTYAAPATATQPSPPPTATPPAPDTLALAEIERQAIFRALEAAGGNRTRAAELLGISIRTLRNKLNEYRAAGLMPASENI